MLEDERDEEQLVDGFADMIVQESELLVDECEALIRQSQLLHQEDENQHRNQEESVQKHPEVVSDVNFFDFYLSCCLAASQNRLDFHFNKFFALYKIVKSDQGSNRDDRHRCQVEYAHFALRQYLTSLHE